MYNQTIESALQLPPRSIADYLVHIYFTTIHSSFPILCQSQFMTDYRIYWQTRSAPNGSIFWISILNIVFAIGALYAHYIQSPYRGLDTDHFVYLLRSRELSQNLMHMLDLPTIECIQLLAVSGVYFIASYQINRCNLTNTLPSVTHG